MTLDPKVQPQTITTASDLPPRASVLLGLGLAILWLLYVVVFSQIGASGLGDALATATANVAPVALLSLFIHSLLRDQVMKRPSWQQFLIHPLLAIAFATAWYGLTLLGLALKRGLQGAGYELPTFYGAAFLWQAQQGVIVYAAVAATCYAIRGGRMAAPVTMVTPASGERLERYLVRTGDDDIRPVLASDIVTITGAQDYSEVSTGAGRHLVRLSLGEFERRLDPARFARVHRSAIINLDQLERLEPAGGGRMLAYMTNGEAVEVSRAGARQLRLMTV